MKTATYIRVSTKDQDYRNQKPALEAFATSRKLEIVAEYAEEESAWKNGHQKELSRLLKDAEAKKFEAVLVWALDRLTREGPLQMLLIYKKLSDHGVRVLSVQETWTELPNEAMLLLLTVFGWVAEMESKRRSERTKAGILRKKLSGGRVGRPPGSRDRKKRGKEGYKLRQARDRIKRAEGN